MRDVAKASGELRSVLIDELHKTFITPLDREDIFNLSHAYDDLIKYALATLEEMHMLGIAADDPIRGMVALVRAEAEALELAMQRLPKNPRLAGEHANEAHGREAEVERIYRKAIHELFARAADASALPAILYRREVYRHISNMSDRADAAANIFGMIVMKLA
jgi:Phosphate transport regulator (distant homolog of PhoU)